jgi:hypothetical protein
MTAPLECQAALETAVVNAILAMTLPAALCPSGPAPNYSRLTCGRSGAGEPRPWTGNLFVAVWHDGSRESKSREAMHEIFGVSVTATVRMNGPYDQLVTARDALESILNPIRAMIHYGIAPGGTQLANIVYNACQLAQLDPGGAYANNAPPGFREALVFNRYDAVQEVGPDWFAAKVGGAGFDVPGLKQTAHFGQASRVQAIFSGMT